MRKFKSPGGRTPERPDVPRGPPGPNVRNDSDTGNVVAPAQIGNTLGAPSPRRPFPADFPNVVQQQAPNAKFRLNEHADYAAAKAGDVDAAARVVRDAVNDKAVEKVRALVGDRKPILVPVHAEEASGRNALPNAYAHALGRRLGLPVDPEIVQSNTPQRTGARGSYRLTHRAEFDGPVEPGRDYLLVDDMVTQGGTLAELRSYIENRGGRVIGATSLTGGQYSHILAPRAETLAKLRAKFPDLEAFWQNEFGHGFDAITESEAHALLKFGSADAIRDRVAAEKQARPTQAPGRDRGGGGGGGEGSAGGAEGSGAGGVTPPSAGAGGGESAALPAIDNDHDVVSGANPSKDPNGPVYIDKRIPEFSPTLKDANGQPANLWKYLSVHERTEADAMRRGMSYDNAHEKVATTAERAAVEADGNRTRKRSHPIDRRS